MDADRNLLFGILCVQNGFVEQASMIAAMKTCTQEQRRALGEILKERGELTPARHDLVEALVAEQLARHGGNAAASLAALRLATSSSDAILQAAVAPALDSNATLAFEGRQESRRVDPITKSTRFRIVRPHARGGLGQISVAEDSEIHRQVALKEIRDDCTDADSIGRFVKEAEITAQLEHPGVVPIYAAGTYSDGRPYYAMRFIQGQELNEAIAAFHQASGGRQPPDSPAPTAGNDIPAGKNQAADAPRSPGLRDLLGRFVDVCQAVAYAHSRGVLHRDLKPGNVMLGKYGETLLLDWGLAKIVGGAEPTSDEPRVRPGSGLGGETLPGHVMGTPAFMSPEQAAGKINQLGPATDIYALGAILHTILSGEPPAKGETIHEILARVIGGDLLPTAGPKPLAAVARKAMALNPDDRHRTALDLAADVERYLADEPVSAYRDPPLARAARSTRKRPATAAGAAAAGLMLLLSLGAGLSLTAEHNRQLAAANGTITAQRDQLGESNANLTRSLAELAASRKEVREALDAATDGAIEELLAGRKELGDRERKYLEAAAKRYEAFARKAGDSDDALAFQAAGLFRVGYIRNRLGLVAEAEAAFVKALAIREKLAAANPALAEHQNALAGSLNDLGLLFRDAGRTKEAEAAWVEALAIREKLTAADPSVAAYQNALARGHHNLGLLYGDTGRTKDAETAYGKALAIQEKLAAANPAVPAFQDALATSHYILGVLYHDTRRTKEAETAYGKALAIREKLAAANPAVAMHQNDLARSHHNLGNLYSDTGRTKEAEAAYAKALAIQEKPAAANPAVGEYQYNVALSHNSLGILLRATGRPNEAEAAYGKALAIREKLAADNPAVPAHQVGLGGSLVNLGLLLRDAKQPAKALEHHRRAISVLSAALAKEPRAATASLFLRNAHWGEARALDDLNQHGDAVVAWRKTIEMSPPAVRPLFQTDLAYALARAGLAAEAVKAAADLGPTPQDQWNAACVLSLASVAKGVSAADKEAWQQEAVEWLRLAKQPAERLAEEKALDPLRGREDFKKLTNPTANGATP